MMTALHSPPAQMLSQLLTGLVEIDSELDCSISSLTLDSRQLKPGGLFLACAGGTSHGLDFLQQVVDNGAVAVVWEPSAEWSEERVNRLAAYVAVPLIAIASLGQKASSIGGRFFAHPSRAMSVLGITGTNGKTSTAQFISKLLAPQGECGFIGTLGVGFPGILQSGPYTTPGPVELQRIMANILRQGGRYVAMEVSSHALDQGRVAAINFDVAVLTNLSRDHLDYHTTMEEYANAKQKLFQLPGLRCAVLNLDDAFGRDLLEKIPAGIQVIGYSLELIEDMPDRLDGWVLAREVVPNSDGMQIKVQTSSGSGKFSSKLLGRFNASNMLAVLAVLLYHNVSLNESLYRLAKLETVAGRMERFGGGDQPLVVVDYAHTPDALEHALAAAREHTRQHLICLFGCGGDRDRGKRPEMGAIAERLADVVVVTDDNPRSEDGGQIVVDILAGMEESGKARVERDRATAIRLAIELAEPGDLVMICGKGHEDYQLVGEQRLHFCDREQVKKVLQ